MHSFTTLQRRVDRTRRWLNTTFHQNTATALEALEEDVDTLDVQSIDESFSNLGIQSLSENTFEDEGPTAVLQARTNSKPSTTPTTAHSSLSELENSSESDAALSDHCELCEWLLNRITFGSSYMSDGSVKPEEYARHVSNARKTVIDYELCGRGFENTFRDLRSASKARKRWRKEQEKYYYWKGVKPGWLGQQVHDICELSANGCSCLQRPDQLQESKMVTVNKKMMYQRAQWYPRPPTYHRSTQKSDLRAWHSRIERAKKERKHSQYPGIESRFDDVDDTDDSYTPAWFNDWWDWRRQENWCHICDTPWGRCAGAGCSIRSEVDEIESLTFETSADGKSWKLSWTPTMRPKENRALAVLPYTKQDWVAEGYVGLYTDDDAVPGW